MTSTPAEVMAARLLALVKTSTSALSSQAQPALALEPSPVETACTKVPMANSAMTETRRHWMAVAPLAK